MQIGRVKIADFGLARAVDDISLTQAGTVTGTPLFMSPEQARGEPLDHRSDLFSLGSVLYALCTGHPPFQAHKTLGVLKRTCDDTPRPIREINPAIPEALAATINRLLVKDPAGRFQTAAEVAELLQQHLAHLDDPAPPLPSVGHADGEITDKLKADAPPLNAVLRPPTKVRQRTRLGLWLAAACVLLVFVGLYLGVALRNNDRSNQANEDERKDARRDNPRDPDANRRQALEQQLAAAPDDAVLALELANLLLRPEPTNWTVLKPSAMKSKGGATLTLQDDGSILASGLNPARDDYSLVARTDLEQISAIRLEALTDPSLPRGGPGRFPGNGNFHLHHLQVFSGGQPCPLTNIVVVYDETQESRSVLDGKIAANEGWGNYPRPGQANTAIIATRLQRAPDDDLTFELHFSRTQTPQHNLGRFRLSVSGDPAAFDRQAQHFAAMKLNDPWARLAAAYALNGHNEEALQFFRKALERAGSYEARRPIVEAAARSDEVLAALIGGQPDDLQLLMAQARRHAERGKQRLAEKQPASARADLEKACAFFTKLPSPGDKWTVPIPVEMKTKTGARMELQKDGSVFVHQSQPAKSDTYTLVFQPELKEIIGVRLEVLADSRLPRGGPGWAHNGNFVLNKLTLLAAFAESPDQPIPIAIRKAFADINRVDWDVQRAVTGSAGTGWAILPQVNKDHVAVFELAEKLGAGAAARLTVRLIHPMTAPDHNLGRFRLSFTNDRATLRAAAVRLELNNSELADCWVALGTACAQQGQTTEAVAAYAEALPLAADRAGKAMVFAAARPMQGLLEKLAERAAGDGLFQAELARHFDKQGNAPLAAAARARARPLLEATLAKEPENTAVAGELADLLAVPTGWTVLKPAEMKADGGATLTRIEDSSILVSGPNPGNDVYVLTFRDLPARIQQLRLEALPHESLPHNGPGRAGEGNFVLTTINAQLDPPTNKGETRSLKLAKAFADFSQQEFSVAGAIDANDNTGWAIHPEEGKPHFALFALAEPVTETGGTVLRVTLEFKSEHKQYGLGRFRLSVSPDPANFEREEKHLPVLKLAEPWAKLAAVYHVLGDHVARDTLVKQHPAAAAGIGDLYAAAKDWERAIAEYRKAVTDQAADVALLIKLAAAYQSAGRTREAVPHLAKVSAANPADTVLSLKVAALQAWFGQEKELAASRQRILAFAKGTNHVGTADQAAKACSIRASTDKAELEAALALARKGVELNKGREWNLLALGMAQYRSGNAAAAEEALLAAAKANPGNASATGTAAFYRAMSLFRQGKPDEARKLVTAAAAKMKPLPQDEQNPLPNNAYPWDDLILWLACKEARALMQPEAIPPPRAENDP